MKIEYKHTLDDFEVFKHNKLMNYNVSTEYDNEKSYHKAEYEIYLKSSYFSVGIFFKDFIRGAPQTRLDSIEKVNTYLEIETGTNPQLTDDKVAL